MVPPLKGSTEKSPGLVSLDNKWSMQLGCSFPKAYLLAWFGPVFLETSRDLNPNNPVQQIRTSTTAAPIREHGAVMVSCFIRLARTGR